MKKSAFILVMALLTLPTNCIAQSDTTPHLSKSEGQPMYQTTKKHTRIPSTPVYVYQYERTLMFDEEHAGDTVIVTDGVNIIFTASLDAERRTIGDWKKISPQLSTPFDGGNL